MATRPRPSREQGEAYAKAHNIIITETIILLESASRETQPMQKSNRRLQGQKQRFSGRCLPEVWQNSFWQCFAWQDGRVLSGVSL